jgi:hypothetical protein
MTLTIDYKGAELELPVKAYSYGYTYRLEVKVGDEVITFEPDEEGCYRAFANEKIDKNLIGAIADSLQKLK